MSRCIFFYGFITLSIRWVVTIWMRVICKHHIIYVKIYAFVTTGSTMSMRLACGSSPCFAAIMQQWRHAAEARVSSQESSLEDLVSVSDSEEAAATQAFWTPNLLADAECLGFKRPVRKQAISLLSGCSGSMAEAAVLKDLRSFGSGFRRWKDGSLAVEP